VAEAAAGSAVDVIVLAGDVRGRQLVLEHLPVDLIERLVITPAGSRAPGADLEPLDAVTAEAVRTHEANRRHEVLDRYRSGGARGLAAAGHAAVCKALDRGQVDTLLVDREVPVPDDFVALAVDTDAELITLSMGEERLPEGVGVLLRYADGAAEVGS
jgi:hypothetical protein